MEPGDQIIPGVEARAKKVAGRGTVEIVMNVVLASPDDLNRGFRLAGEKRSFDGVILNQATAEASADERDVNLDAVARNVEGGGDRIGSCAGNLRGGPEPRTWAAQLAGSMAA